MFFINKLYDRAYILRVRRPHHHLWHYAEEACIARALFQRRRRIINLSAHHFTQIIRQTHYLDFTTQKAAEVLPSAAFCSTRLGARYVDGGRSLLAFRNFKGKLVAYLELFESYAIEVLRVEEQILRLAIARDEGSVLPL